MPTKPTRLLATALFAAFLALPAAAARVSEPGADGWCGTSDVLLDQILARHLHNRELDDARAAAKRAREIALKTEVRKEGNVAVAIDNSGRMIRERNLLDLEQGFSLQFRFKKKQGGYQARRAGSFNGQIGERVALGDDDSARIDLPFKVKVFGRRYDALYVNSDGNVTFGEGDSLSTSRDISRFLEGPPRLAPFFADLNPETAPAGGGVFALVGAKSVRITWSDLPEFDPNGFASTRNTFQLNLAKNGKVTFSYGEMASRVGIVGLAPGGGSPLNLLDYSEQLPAPVVQGAIAESFSDQLSIDETVIAQVFLEHFADRYMSLVVFTDFGFLLLGNLGTVAYEQTIKNDIRGIGEPVYDVAEFFGSSGALESFVMMGDVTKYGDDIEDPNQLGGVYSPLDILMHELGHRWGVRLLFDDGGQSSEALLGRGRAHWSYCFNSERSYLEGNRWQDNDGDGIFMSIGGPASYNDFDLYSMGLLEADAVRPSFLIADGCNGDRAPSLDGAASGEVKDIAIDDVVAALGERSPAFPLAPQRFEIAFILLVRAGEEPRPGSVALVNAFRKGAEQRLAEQGGRFVTKLRPKK